MQDGPTFLTSQDVSVSTTYKTEQLGKVGQTYDGRFFAYVSFGGTTALTSGQLVVAAVAPTNSTGLAIATAQPFTTSLLATSTSINIVNGATAVTQDQFAEGTIDILGVNGLSSYKIKGNSATAAAGTITVTLLEGLRNIVALTAANNTVNLSPSFYATVITSVTQSVPVGVTIAPVPQSATVSYFGWVQTRGRAQVINDATATLVKGGTVAQSTTVAGSVIAFSGVYTPIGAVKESTVASIGAPVYLSIT